MSWRKACAVGMVWRLGRSFVGSGAPIWGYGERGWGPPTNVRLELGKAMWGILTLDCIHINPPWRVSSRRSKTAQRIMGDASEHTQ